MSTVDLCFRKPNSRDNLHLWCTSTVCWRWFSWAPFQSTNHGVVSPPLTTRIGSAASKASERLPHLDRYFCISDLDIPGGSTMTILLRPGSVLSPFGLMAPPAHHLQSFLLSKPSEHTNQLPVNFDNFYFSPYSSPSRLLVLRFVRLENESVSLLTLCTCPPASPSVPKLLFLFLLLAVQGASCF